MSDLYRITKELYKSHRTKISRATRIADHQSVILKIRNKSLPADDGSDLIREYNIGKTLKGEYFAQYLALNQDGQSLILEMVDDNMRCLKSSIPKKGFNLDTFLRIAIRLASMVETIHVQRITHRDFNPTNIIWNEITPRLKIIDFGLASLYSPELDVKEDPETFAGTLAYMSPEQTGRVNYPQDYRTDLYALGISLYELLTGHLPFQSSDPLELVHCHIAKQPPPIADSRPDVPAIISDIIMKLLEKMPDDRYQYATSVKDDLRKCVKLINSGETGAAIQFPLGENDVSGKVRQPRKPIAVKKETQLLENAMGRVRKGATETILISGYSGSGKTFLLKYIRDRLPPSPVIWAIGFFQNRYSDIPFDGISQAVNQLFQYWLRESDETLLFIQRELTELFKDTAYIINNLMPDTKHFISSQPPDHPVNKIQLNYIIRKALREIIGLAQRMKQPVVLCLENLHWADRESMNLIEELTRDLNSKYLFIIGTYRHDELDKNRDIKATISKWEEDEAFFSAIHLNNLPLEDTRMLIAEILFSDLPYLTPFSDLIHKKTKGNPLLTYELIKSLHQNRLLSRNTDTRQWQWDELKINELEVSENVIALMRDTLSRLPRAYHAILAIGSCIGMEFDLETVSAIAEDQKEEVFQILSDTVSEGLLEYLPEKSPTQKQDKHKSPNPGFRFINKHIKQTLYETIKAADLPKLHYQIGNWILQNTPDYDNDVINLVKHLNTGIRFVKTPQTKLQLAKLNLSAGRIAQVTGNAHGAFDYFSGGINLLPHESWTSHYYLTLELYEEAAISAASTGNYGLAEEWCYAILNAALDPVDTVKTYITLIRAYDTQNNHQKAIDSGLEILTLLGFPILRTPDKETISHEFDNILSLLPDDINDLIDLPEMTDEKALAAMRILSNLTPASYLSQPNLYTMLVFQEISLSLSFGNTRSSSNGCADFSIILYHEFNEAKLGNQFLDLALRLSDKINDDEATAKVLLKASGWIFHRSRHIASFLQIFKTSYEKSISTGLFFHAAYSRLFEIEASFLAGIELGQLNKQVTRYESDIVQSGQSTPLERIQIFHLTINHLISPTKTPWILSGETLKEETILSASHHGTQDASTFELYLCKLILAFMFDNPHAAAIYTDHARKTIGAIRGSFLDAAYYLFDSLIQISAYTRTSDHNAQTNILSRINHNQSKLHTLSLDAPMNYTHQLNLVEAEIHRAKKQIPQAITAYEAAISGAKANQFPQYEALAFELAAKFYRELGNERVFQSYLSEAYNGYEIWGALAKLKDLEKKFPNIVFVAEKAPLSTTSTSKSGSSYRLDVLSVVKAAQMLSGEVQLESLLKNLIHIGVENAGAEKGVLILCEDDDLVIQAIKTTTPDHMEILKSIPIRDWDDIPLSIVKYVYRTKTLVILDNAEADDQFSGCEYLKRKPVKSVLCMPISYQNNLKGILYLENNQATNVFTARRTELLEVIISQAAISIENARLFKASQIATQNSRESEVRFRGLVESSDDWIWELDENNTFSYSSPKAKTITGYEIDEILGQKPYFIMSPDETKRVSAFTSSPEHKTTTITHFENTVFHKDGRQIILDTSSIPILNEKGEVIGRRGVNRDITTRKRATEALEISERKYRVLIEKAPEPIIVVKQGIIEYANPNALILTGYSEKDIYHMPFINFIPPEDAEQLIQTYSNRILGASAPPMTEIRVLTRTGQIRWAKAIAVEIEWEGKPSHLYYMNDITEQKESEETTRALIASSPMGIMIFSLEQDDRLVLNHSNQAADQMFGIDGSRLIGNTMEEAFPWSIQIGSPDRCRRVAKGGPSVYIEQVNDKQYPSGGAYEIYMFQMIQNKVAIFYNDITERKAAEKKLQHAQQYIENIIDSMPSVLVGVDPSGKITQWNRQAEKRTGTSANLALDCALSDVFPHLSTEMEQVTLAMKEQQVFSNIRKTYTRDGETRFEDITIYPLITNGLQGAVIRLDDVTEKVRLEEMMIQNEKMHSIGGLAAGMAHEINNPLGVIMGLTQNITRRFSTDLKKNVEIATAHKIDLKNVNAYMKDRKILDYFEGITESSDRAASIVRNMLDFSRKSESVRKECDIHKILKKSIDLASSDYDLKKGYDVKSIQIIKEYEDSLPRLNILETEIQQVFINLIRNAAQAMNEKDFQEEKPMIWIRTRHEHNWIQIDIEDNGPGMDEPTRKKVFEPFFTTKQVGIGTGLGLSVSYFIVTQTHNGRFWVESELGKGTKFSMQFPVEGTEQP